MNADIYSSNIYQAQLHARLFSQIDPLCDWWQVQTWPLQWDLIRYTAHHHLRSFHRHMCVVAIRKTVKWIIGLLSGVFKRIPSAHPLKSCISQVLCLQATETGSGSLEQERYFLDEHRCPSTTDERPDNQALYMMGTRGAPEM